MVMETTVLLDHETQALAFLTSAQAAGQLPPGSLMVLAADRAARLVLPVGIDEVPDDPPQDERIGALAPLLQVLAGVERCGGVLLAVGRHGDPKPRGGDFGWHDAFTQGTAAAGLACHGTYVVTPTGARRVRPLLAPPELAAA
jgi:hypothetical protein